MPNIEIKVSGDIAGVATLPKQITFAASRTINDLLERAQTNVIGELGKGLHIRGNWRTPGTRYGINAKFAKGRAQEGSIGTAADWLLEEEGFNDGVKRADHFSKNRGGVPSELAQPMIGTARPSLLAKMPPGQKAGKLLQNTKRTKAFIVTSKKTGRRLVLQRVGQTAAGELLRDSRGNLRIGRKKERTGGTRVVLKAALQPSVWVPQKHIFINTAVKTLNAGHFVDRLSKNLINALKTARF